jgi:TRAP-type mannitol/chloroaromatic compound transport system substrate-binding protein
VTNPRDDLRATEQSIHRDAETIVELEERKARLDPTDPEVEKISDLVQDAARTLVHKTSAEQELVDEIQAAQKRRQRN